jgi:bifunctional non-homologous end joining protein LigD
VRLTHPERVLYPEQGITKLDLARHYERVAEWMLPHVVDRPLTLVRCPQGRAKQCFYQKHASESVPSGLRVVEIMEKRKGLAPYYTLRDLSGTISLVQIGVLEVHVWGSRADRMEKPDRLVFDLDPGEGVPWARVVEAAHQLRARLAALDLDAFLKTTGGKGLHLVVPIERRHGWDEVEAFARAVANDLIREEPGRYLTSVSKAERSGRILIDVLRNARGSTWVAPYSTRARPGAPVSMPLEWDELSERLHSDAFSVSNVPARLTRRRVDPWRELSSLRQRLPRSAARS